MQVTVFGANGHVGSLVVKQLLEDHHTVVASVHSRSTLGIHDNLVAMQGDSYQYQDVAAAIKGSDGVICALGSWGTKRKDVVSSATKNIIPAMKEAGITRFISVTGADSKFDGDKKTLIHSITHAAFMVIAKPIMVDSEKHLIELYYSDLDWTTIRSPVMLSGDGERHTLTMKRPLPIATITYAAVARAMVDQLSSDAWIKQAPYINR